MAEYFLRIITRETTIKRMDAENDDAAIEAAIKWEGHNPDLDLTCGLRRVALSRKFVWYLRPDADCDEKEQASSRHVIDDFTKAVEWTGKLRGTSNETRSASSHAQGARRNYADAITRLIERLNRLD